MRYVSSLLLLASAFAGLGQMPTALAGATTYTLDTSHTQIVFSVERFGFNRVIGLLDGIEGEVVFDEAAPGKSSVHATIPVARLNTGNPERDGFLRGKLWLNGDAFPTIEFRSTSVKLLGGQRFEVQGTLSLAGVTAPVTFQASFNRRGPDHVSKRPAVGFSGAGALSRGAFGVRIAAPAIGDEVRFNIETVAIEKSPESASPK
ncbi:MAG: polyisoprenoid-binding protein [Alphaproteobacteria bacterium]|nr:polyisoprenoid-binding protein [Alphaproteobacteria bacterium]